MLSGSKTDASDIDDIPAVMLGVHTQPGWLAVPDDPTARIQPELAIAHDDAALATTQGRHRAMPPPRQLVCLSCGLFCQRVELGGNPWNPALDGHERIRLIAPEHPAHCLYVAGEALQRMRGATVNQVTEALAALGDTGEECASLQATVECQKDQIRAMEISRRALREDFDAARDEVGEQTHTYMELKLVYLNNESLLEGANA